MTDFIITAPGEYKTRDGRKAVVLEIFENLAFGRAPLSDGCWVPCRWEINGLVPGSKEIGPLDADIIAPWTEPETPWEGCWMDNSADETAPTTPGLRVRQTYPPA